MNQPSRIVRGRDHEIRGQAAHVESASTVRCVHVWAGEGRDRFPGTDYAVP